MYVTGVGDCWDMIAKVVYGSERRMGFLMKNNMPLLDTVVFSAGTRLKIPDLPKEEDGIPPWRKGV